MAKVEVLNFHVFRFLSHVPSGKLIFDLCSPRHLKKTMIFQKWKSLKNDSNYNVVWDLGMAKGRLFWYVFWSIWKQYDFEIVKKTLVFIVYSAWWFSKSWWKNNDFLILEGRLSRTAPDRKCSYFIRRMQNSPSKKVILMIFRGGPERAQERILGVLISGTPVGSFFLFFDENLNISLDQWKIMICWCYKYSENVMF